MNDGNRSEWSVMMSGSRWFVCGVALMCGLWAGCSDEAGSFETSEEDGVTPSVHGIQDVDSGGMVEQSDMSPDVQRDADPSIVGEEDMAASVEDMVVSIDMSSPDVLMPRDVDRSDIVSMEREVPVYLPEAYDNSTRIPLIVALHGYATSGSYLDNYLELQDLVKQTDVALLIPEGRRNLSFSKYWTATDACCSYQNLDNLGDADVLFLRDVIAQAKERYEISKVYVIGHSNGGYMSYRMACDAADVVDGIMSLAGATFNDQERCAPSRPVKILQVHGTSDGLVPFGGSGFRNIPSAEETIAYWSEYNQCQTGPVVQEKALDLVSGSTRETDVIGYSDCAGAASVTLWKINGSGHNPGLHDDFMLRVLDYLEN